MTGDDQTQARQSAVFAHARDVLALRVAGEVVLLRMDDEAVTENTGLRGLNDSAAAAWDLVDGRRSLADVVAYLEQAYSVRGDDLLGEIAALFEQLSAAGFLVAVDAG
jgi:hypothetical protein